MKIESMTTLHQANGIRNITIVPSKENKKKWNLQFEAMQMEWHVELLVSRRGNIRQFATLETVVNLLKALEIKEVMLKIS